MPTPPKFSKNKLTTDNYDCQADLAPLLSWRVIATGISFVFFGLGGVVLSTLVYPLLFLFPMTSHRRKRISRKILSTSFRFYIKLMEVMGVVKLEVHGLSNLKPNGQLVIANHPSLLDVVYLISMIENTSSLVKKSMWFNPFTAGTVISTDYIRNDGDNPLQDCVDTLNAGDSLIIFPEGTRTDPDKPFKFHRGAANIALAAQKNILPVKISSNPPRLLKNQPWYQASKQTLHITIECLPDFDTTSYWKSDKSRSLVARKLTKDLQELFIE